MNERPNYPKLMSEALRQIWGYDHFRPHQAETVAAIIEGRDSLTVLPTGGGKSLCYQLPACILPGTAIVISPLISLMADQVNALILAGVPAAFLNSSLSPDEVRATKTRFFRNELKILYVSPERMMLDHFQDELKQVKPSFFAIDEAHCISQWGHDFRPEYTQLQALRELFPNVGIHAFTATAPPAVREEITGQLRLDNPLVLVGDYHRANLFYRATRRGKIKNQVLQFLADLAPGDLGIIYCLTRKETEKTAAYLEEQGIKALPYHAGLDATTRKLNQVRFSQEKVRVMVATVAFGMGIDQSNVRFVIHIGMPRSLSHYQQESGRAGRDGLPSQCLLFYGAQDIQFWKRIIENEEPALAPARLRQLQDMIAYATQLQCRHKTLVEYFGQVFDKPDCGGCDVCRGEVESLDDSRLFSRMILSAVLKTRQSFGAAHVALVLTGSKDQKVLRNNHDQLSVYNLLGSHSQHQVHDWINQLESQGYLERAGNEFPTLNITNRGLWLLRPDKYGKSEKDLPVFLVETRPSAKPAKRPAAPQTFEQKLFEKLRRARAELAISLGVPAFMVFGDRSLQDMAARKPTSEQDFLNVFGVGEAKLKKFGAVMLAIIRQHLAEEGITATRSS